MYDLFTLVNTSAWYHDSDDDEAEIQHAIEAILQESVATSR